MKKKRMLTAEQRKIRRRRGWRITLALALLMFAGALLAGAWLFDMDAWDKLDMSKILDVPQSVIVLDADGEEVSVLHAAEDRICVDVNTLPKHVLNAFVSAEDARFYEHFGVDIVRIFGAAWADLKAGAYVQGASTISQQLIKLSHLTNEKKMYRKLEEAVLAYQMERLYDKDEIIEMYLNYVYFGGGYYGIEAAARGYFGVRAETLSVAQSAQLAGILKSPARFAPHLHPDNSVGRRNVVLSLMEEYGYLSAEECLTAQAEPVQLVHGTEPERRGYYVDLALQEACETLGISMNALLCSGYRIETAMHRELQERCEAVFADGTYFPDNAESGLEGALVIVDVESGNVAALVGGRHSDVALAYNRATRIRRQPGSVIKPILVYAPALETGYTAATMLLDEQIDFDGYMPSNANGRFSGWVTMREAVTRSLNVPAVTVMAQVGVNRSKTFAQQLGISFDERDLSLALALGGFTYGVSPYQIAGAYAAFARGGVYQKPQLVERITDADGTELYRADGVKRRVMSEANAYVLTSMLKSAVQTGTGKRLGALDIPLAGKTGTTGDETGNRDVWMAAYNPAYAAAVWIGYDDGARVMPDTATGGTYPALILKTVFETLYPSGGAPDFSMPGGVREFRIDQYTLESEHIAVLANALTPEASSYSEVFVTGTEPDALTSYWQVPAPPETLSVDPGDGQAEIRFEMPSRHMIYRLYRENSKGKSILLSEFSGGDGSAVYRDGGVRIGGSYSYYVIPVHPQLLIDGQAVTGPASKRVLVTIEDD